jgi:hypothetical protein
MQKIKGLQNIRGLQYIEVSKWLRAVHFSKFPFVFGVESVHFCILVVSIMFVYLHQLKDSYLILASPDALQ